jgi:hypothetical protein
MIQGFLLNEASFKKNVQIQPNSALAQEDNPVLVT